jgi:hypothetical protein
VNFHSGKEAGTTFELLFERQCQLAGLWAESHGIKSKRGWNGRLVELKSDLDYKVMGRGGKICIVDCKTFDDPHFTFSRLAPHQVELAQRYNDWGIPAGFVVWFRPVNLVSFFAGWLIGARGPGARFIPQDGKLLGTWDHFDPTALLLSYPTGSPP